MALGLLVRDRTGTSQEMLTTMLTSTAHALADDMVEYKDRPPTQAADPELLGLLGPLPPLPGGRRVGLPGCPYPGEWSALCAALAGEVDLAGRRPVRRRGGPAGQRRRAGRRCSSRGVRRASRPSTGRTRCWRPTSGASWRTASRPRRVLQSAEFAGAADMLVEVEHPTFGEHVRLKPYIAFSRSATVAEPGVAGRAAHRCHPGASSATRPRRSRICERGRSWPDGLTRRRRPSRSW